MDVSGFSCAMDARYIYALVLVMCVSKGMICGTDNMASNQVVTLWKAGSSQKEQQGQRTIWGCPLYAPAASLQGQLPEPFQGDLATFCGSIGLSFFSRLSSIISSHGN